MGMNTWYEQLASHGMKMSKDKTKVIVVTRQKLVPQVAICRWATVTVEHVTVFRYLGSWLHKNGALEREIEGKTPRNWECHEECKLSHL